MISHRQVHRGEVGLQSPFAVQSCRKAPISTTCEATTPVSGWLSSSGYSCLRQLLRSARCRESSSPRAPAQQFAQVLLCQLPRQFEVTRRNHRMRTPSARWNINWNPMVLQDRDRAQRVRVVVIGKVINEVTTGGDRLCSSSRRDRSRLACRRNVRRANGGNRRRRATCRIFSTSQRPVRLPSTQFGQRSNRAPQGSKRMGPAPGSSRPGQSFSATYAARASIIRCGMSTLAGHSSSQCLQLSTACQPLNALGRHVALRQLACHRLRTTLALERGYASSIGRAGRTDHIRRSASCVRSLPHPLH